jgi:hypothetical protein
VIATAARFVGLAPGGLLAHLAGDVIRVAHAQTLRPGCRESLSDVGLDVGPRFSPLSDSF